MIKPGILARVTFGPDTGLIVKVIEAVRPPPATSAQSLPRPLWLVDCQLRWVTPECGFFTCSVAPERYLRAFGAEVAGKHLEELIDKALGAAFSAGRCAEELDEESGSFEQESYALAEGQHTETRMALLQTCDGMLEALREALPIIEAHDASEEGKARIRAAINKAEGRS